ncbi:MAG: LiaF domain-containing protein [Gemmatimonadota bacterium]
MMGSLPGATGRSVRAALTALLVAAPLHGQGMQQASAARQLFDQTSLHATVSFAAGTVILKPAASGMLYRMTADFDPLRFVPVSKYDGAAQSVSLGIQPTGQGGITVSSRAHLAQSATIELSREVPLVLDLNLGAAEATADLGGLRLKRVSMATAGSKAVVRFSQVNPGRCDSLVVNAGAAEVTLESLGNSRCQWIRLGGGAGGVNLDLSGAWAAEARVRVSVAVGRVKLTIPKDLGVELTLEQFLSSFEPKGFVRNGKVWQTPGYAQATHRIAVNLSTTVGGVNVTWVP